MAGFVKVTTKRPTYRSGGGALKAAITAAGGRAADEVHALVLDTVRGVVDRSVAAAGPGEARKGWPIGPPRPWEPGHVHSVTRFNVRDESRGWYVKITIENPANYTRFIHAPRSSENVYQREIGRPLATAIERLRDDVARLIKHKMEGR